MKEMVQTIKENMVQAWYGEGPWAIADGSKIKLINKEAWLRKGPELQRKEFLRVICGMPYKNENVKTEDIPDFNLSNGIKKKKHQRTQCQANRTLSKQPNNL